MNIDTKTKMIEGTLKAIATKGPKASSFSELIKATGTPRGSIYHHFPGGKDELVSAAIKLAGQQTLESIARTRGEPAQVVAEVFLTTWRQLLTTTNFTIGCSVVAVSISSDNKSLLKTANSIFRAWQKLLSELLKIGGLTQANAVATATMLIAGAEGAIILSRAKRSIEPFDSVTKSLLQVIKHLLE